MIDLYVMFSAFTGAMAAILFNKFIELLVLRAEIKRKKTELREMMEITEHLSKLMGLVEKADENNKTRKTK